MPFYMEDAGVILSAGGINVSALAFYSMYGTIGFDNKNRLSNQNKQALQPY
jgi:hypothetical protein